MCLCIQQKVENTVCNKKEIIARGVLGIEMKVKTMVVYAEEDHSKEAECNFDKSSL